MMEEGVERRERAQGGGAGGPTALPPVPSLPPSGPGMHGRVLGGARGSGGLSARVLFANKTVPDL